MSQGYAALFELEPEGGFMVTFPDIGYGATYGAAWEEALRQAEDMLEEAILGMIAHNEDVPAPSPAKGHPVVRLPALTAAKLEVYRAMRQAGLDEAQLAQRLGLRWLSRRPPRTARSRARHARPPVRGDIGTSVIEQRRD
jgi:antitoxin HicB